MSSDTHCMHVRPAGIAPVTLVKSRPAQADASKHTRASRVRAPLSSAIVLALSAAALSAMPSAWAENYVPYGYKFQPFSYDAITNPREGRFTFSKDPNVWVYTRRFAQRFGMPAQWIDDSLQGAEAIAFRIEQSNTQTCGYFGEADNCRRNLDCVFDIYLTDADGAKLPWESHKSSDRNDSDSSMRFLAEQTEEDHWYWTDEVHGKRYVRLGSMGLRSVVYVEGPPEKDREGGKKAFSGHGDMYMKGYRRDFYKGLDLITLNGCGLPAPDRSKPVSIDFLDPQPSMYEPKYRLSDGRIDRAKLDAAKKSRYKRWDAGKPPHKVRLPDAYLDKVVAHEKAERHPRSLEKAAWDRLISQKTPDTPEPTASSGFWQRLLRWFSD
ncbi:MAG: hypothetical protein GKR94_26495 [Gammaproteobacteria bacterium]|nr:hypothetical protein [Gammaproteobacteria bacterium]